MRRVLTVVAVLGGVLALSLLGHVALTSGMKAGGAVGRVAASTCAACH